MLSLLDGQPGSGDATAWTALIYLAEWLIRIGALVVIPFRRSPDAAKGWLLLILFMPWVGLALYAVIGRPDLPAWRVRRLASLRPALAEVRKRFENDPNVTRPQLSPSLAVAASLATNLGRFHCVGGNAAEILADYDGTIAALVADIDGAQQHVHLLFYIFADDAAGQRVVGALARAVTRGVHCRVLVDYLGSKEWLAGLKAKLATAGVAMHAVLPVGLFRWRAARIDLRNHRKIAVIDGRIAYTGSQNLVDAAFKKGLTYEELVVRVMGPVVLQLQGVFVADWFLETGELLDSPELFVSPRVEGSVSAQTFPSGPGLLSAGVQRLIVALVHGAREQVCLVTPYFVPDEALLQALQIAVLRGVEVHLVVSRIADQWIVSLAQKSYYAALLAAGVRIHRYAGRFLHAKNLTIDREIAFIGSCNMDHRSFLLNQEVTLLFYDREVAARLRAQQEQYFASSTVLDAEDWAKRPLAVKVLENLARQMSPLL